jgi:phosphoribosylanthranilate isomerase
MKVKICGLRSRENIAELAALKPDYMGFIFYKGSPRYVGEDFDESVTWGLPTSIKKVGVFVNDSLLNIFATTARYNLDYVQLHGEETPEMCRELRNYVKVIKAFPVGETFDYRVIDPYHACCDHFLFDTKSAGHGGSGLKFDHTLLNKEQIKKPFFVSGGIDTGNLNELKILNPYAIDLNSKFELSPGIKSTEKVRDLLNSNRFNPKPETRNKKTK